MSKVAIVLLTVVGLTSLGAYAVGARWLGLPRAGLRRAWTKALDCVGLAIVFLLANLVVGVALVFGFRTLTGRFLSVYVLNDATLGVLSAVQALVFQWWSDRRL